MILRLSSDFWSCWPWTDLQNVRYRMTTPSTKLYVHTVMKLGFHISFYSGLYLQCLTVHFLIFQVIDLIEISPWSRWLWEEDTFGTHEITRNDLYSVKSNSLYSCFWDRDLLFSLIGITCKTIQDRPNSAKIGLRFISLFVLLSSISF